MHEYARSVTRTNLASLQWQCHMWHLLRVNFLWGLKTYYNFETAVVAKHPNHSSDWTCMGWRCRATVRHIYGNVFVTFDNNSHCLYCIIHCLTVNSLCMRCDVHTKFSFCLSGHSYHHLHHIMKFVLTPSNYQFMGSVDSHKLHLWYMENMKLLFIK